MIMYIFIYIIWITTSISWLELFLFALFGFTIIVLIYLYEIVTMLLAFGAMLWRAMEFPSFTLGQCSYMYGLLILYGPCVIKIIVWITVWINVDNVVGFGRHVVCGIVIPTILAMILYCTNALSFLWMKLVYG